MAFVELNRLPLPPAPGCVDADLVPEKKLGAPVPVPPPPLELEKMLVEPPAASGGFAFENKLAPAAWLPPPKRGDGWPDVGEDPLKILLPALGPEF